MKKVFFTVGPSQIYPTLPKHLQRALLEDIPSLNHRGGEFKKLFSDTSLKLKRLLKIPSSHAVFFISSALEGMERTIQSTVESISYHIITGSFGKTWMNISKQLGKEAIAAPGVDVKNLLVPKDAEIICITQNDTSTGIQILMDDIYVLKKKYPKKLISLDVVSSIPYVDINYELADVTFFSVQKGFGLPAGLGVIIVSPEAMQKCGQLVKKRLSIGSFHSFENLYKKALDSQTPETPNVLNIYLFNKVLTDMLDQGISKIRKETDQKTKMMYDFFDAHPTLQPAISELEMRSQTTLVINTSGNTAKIRKKLSEAGFEIGAGYGDRKDDQIRIANFPSHTLSQVKQLLKNLA